MSELSFREFADVLARQNGRTFMAPVIEKELLHYEILRVMGEHGFLNSLTFQGGTCLRLCYGAQRYSEDLDFAGGTHFDAGDLNELKDCIERSLPELYRLAVDVTEPKTHDAFVKKWRIRIDTALDRPDLPKQKISLEVASIPAYTSVPRMLRLNYVGLPSSYADVIVRTESMGEILADKMESFICSPHVRYRDIWDIFWLVRQPDIDVALARDMRAQKAADYDEVERFSERIVPMLADLPQIIEGREFHDQLRRFLPFEIFEKTIANPDYRLLMCDGIRELYEPRYVA